jgi:serine/threonine protein phosphatase PrpC
VQLRDTMDLVAGRASIVGAAATHVGKVREHNEDAHFFDQDLGVFLVCDGMGGHAAGEVASAIAIRTIRSQWGSDETAKLIEGWIEAGSPDLKKELLGLLRAGVTAAHDAIIAEAVRDETKKGMGTTLVGAVIVGNELVFAHAGDSRAYLVRDAIAMQLTEDHTLLARLLAAGIDVDQSGEGSRFKSMLTNALGIGEECKVSTFIVPLADGDRFLLCSDGISEYVPEAEVGEVLTKQPSPARAAQKLIELALERGGADNATAIVVRVLEAGETPLPAEVIKRDDDVIAKSPFWGPKVTPQQRLRALRIAIPRDHNIGERLPAHHLGDRVAWIIVEGKVVQDGNVFEGGTLLYPESLVADSQQPDRDGLAVARTDVRAIAIRADDFRELCEDDSELGEALLETLAPLIAERSIELRSRKAERSDTEHDDETTNVIATAYAKPEPPVRPSQPMAAVSPAEAERKDRIGRAITPVSGVTPVSDELDERFDAVTGRAPTPVPADRPSSERIPLILNPRAKSDPGRATPMEAAVMQAIDSAPVQAPRAPRPPSEPEIERVEDDDIPRPGPRIRLDSEPIAEMVIEMEADEPDDLAEATPPPVVRVIENTDGKITETIHDNSEQTLTVTVTESADGTVRRPPTEPITSGEGASTAGSISVSRPSTKR